METAAIAEELHRRAAEFLAALWEADVDRGIWQIVHGLDGSMILLHGLEGPQALETIARTAHG